MNIKDLPQGSYTPVKPTNVGSSGKLNINNLPQGSYTPVEPKPFTYNVPDKALPTQDRTTVVANARANAEALKNKADNTGSVLGILGSTAKEIGSTIASSELGLGKSLGKIYGNQSEDLSNVIRDTNEQQMTIQKNIRLKEKQGQDTTKLKQLYNQNIARLAELNKNLSREADLPTDGQVAGQLLGTGLDVLTAGQLSPVMKTGKLAYGGSKLGAVLPEATKVGELATKQATGLFTKKGALNVAKGAGIGYGFDVSQGLQGNRGEDRTGTNALYPGMGTAIGGLLPALNEGAQSVKNIKSTKNVNSAIDNLEQTYKDIQSGTTPGKKKLAKIEAKTEAMNKSGTEGKTPARILAENGIVPNRQGPKLDTVEQAAKFREKINPLHEANTAALKEVGLSTAPIRIDDLEREAIAYAKTPQNVNSGRFDKMQGDIRREFDILRGHYKTGEVPLSTVDDIKSARWENVFKNKSLVEADALKKDSEYAIAKAMQKKIENVAAEAGHTEVAQLNREIGDRLEASRFLEDLNGKTIKGGRALKYITTLIGSEAGSTIPGKILGALGGNVVGELIISNTIANPVKRMLLKNLETKNPAAYTKTLEWLSKQNLDRETRLLLPAPSYIPMSSANEKITQVIPAQKYPTSVNPKTGQFQKMFKTN